MAKAKKVFVRIISEEDTKVVEMTEKQALQCATLLQKGVQEQEYPKKVNEILEKCKEVPIMGTISTCGEGWGWSDSDDENDDQVGHQKLFAIPYGTDDTCGDSSWNTQQFVEFAQGDTFEMLIEKVKKAAEDPEHPLGFIMESDEEDTKKTLDEIVGFWVITKKLDDMMKNMEMDCGSDTAVYLMTRMLKEMAKSNAVYDIKRK